MSYVYLLNFIPQSPRHLITGVSRVLTTYHPGKAELVHNRLSSVCDFLEWKTMESETIAVVPGVAGVPLGVQTGVLGQASPEGGPQARQNREGKARDSGRTWFNS